MRVTLATRARGRSASEQLHDVIRGGGPGASNYPEGIMNKDADAPLFSEAAAEVFRSQPRAAAGDEVSTDAVLGALLARTRNIIQNPM